MKIEGRLFALTAVFFLGIAIIYWVLSRDPIGTTALAMSAGLAFLVRWDRQHRGHYFWQAPTHVAG